METRTKLQQTERQLSNEGMTDRPEPRRNTPARRAAEKVSSPLEMETMTEPKSEIQDSKSNIEREQALDQNVVKKCTSHTCELNWKPYQRQSARDSNSGLSEQANR